jgi:hypothetical protein
VREREREREKEEEEEEEEEEERRRDLPFHTRHRHHVIELSLHGTVVGVEHLIDPSHRPASQGVFAQPQGMSHEVVLLVTFMSEASCCRLIASSMASSTTTRLNYIIWPQAGSSTSRRSPRCARHFWGFNPISVCGSTSSTPTCGRSCYQCLGALS